MIIKYNRQPCADMRCVTVTSTMRTCSQKSFFKSFSFYLISGRNYFYKLEYVTHVTKRIFNLDKLEKESKVSIGSKLKTQIKNIFYASKKR